MDFAHLERYRPEAQGALTVRLSEVDAVALEGVRQTGRGVFTLGEAVFDEAMPDEYARRIASLRVTVPGLGEGLGGRPGPFCCWQQQRRPNADRIWPAPHRGEFSARAPVLVVMERSLLGKGVVHLESKRRDRSVCRSSGAMIATQQVTNALVGQIEHLCGQAISAVAHFG